MDELKSLNSLNFPSFDFVFKARSCNRAAYELARLGASCVEGEDTTSYVMLLTCVFVIRQILLENTAKTHNWLAHNATTRICPVPL